MSIDKYDVSHAVFLGGERLNRIYLHLYCSEGSGYIGFWPKDPDDIIPPSRIESTSPFKFSLFYELDRYQEIIDTLRYEKPVQLAIGWDANNIITSMQVYTGREPVGEQEGQGASFTT